jgi:hypothetical protein
MRRFITITLTSLTLTLASAASGRAQEKPKTNADMAFLTRVIPGTAASVKIIEYGVKNAADEKVRGFAERVAKQHQESVKPRVSTPSGSRSRSLPNRTKTARERSTNCPSSKAPTSMLPF